MRYFRDSQWIMELVVIIHFETVIRPPLFSKLVKITISSLIRIWKLLHTDSPNSDNNNEISVS
jgi:hypothetical protein